ncbi:MAG TPA: TraB/GumN family protein [Allosphingosinicella sp.]|nr:TraB/GumN family protein [Allosphingosinicella sp.]
MTTRWSRMKLAGSIAALWLAAPSLAAPAPAPAPALQPPAAAAPRGEPRPAIWLLADADTRIYLFGTVHVLHPGLRWRSVTLDRVVREARELVLELDDAEMAASGPEAFGAMQLGKSVPVLQRVTPERRAALARLLGDLQVPEGSLDGLETWAVAVILGVGQMAREYTGAGDGAGEGAPDLAAAAAALPGVEEVLTAEFRANGRPITGVETAADQIDAFRGMPLPVQQAMLDETIDAYARGDEAGDPDETDWVNGNLEGIAAQMESLPPELFETLVTRRNRNFADWLAARLDRPGTVLFAVGAGHLAGRVSVQSMLESRGFVVRRLN